MGPDDNTRHDGNDAPAAPRDATPAAQSRTEITDESTAEHAAAENADRDADVDRPGVDSARSAQESTTLLPGESAPKRSVSISVPTLIWSAVCGAVAVVAIVLGVLLMGARSELADRDAVQADRARAEQIATDYAVGAATINYQRLDEWFTALKHDTTTELANKFDATAPKLEEILTPLQWNSTATPTTAKVMSESDGVFTVNVFVTVSSTNAQNPEGVQTSVTYNVTISEPDGWKITDVGDSGMLPAK